MSGLILPGGADERGDAKEGAQIAFARMEARLRAQGAIGTIGVGYDPRGKAGAQWWARCSIRRTDDLPRQVLVQHQPTGLAAMESLCDATKRPELLR